MSALKVYIACHSKEMAQKEARRLQDAGEIVVSRWHSGEFLPTQKISPEDRFQLAIEDLNDIKRADYLILISGPDKYSGGKFVEAGIAYGLGKPVFVNGRRENILCYLFEVLT